jgi:iron complex transport system substrate-binding protein
LGFVPNSSLTLRLAAAFAAGLSSWALAGPERVVSVNLCTDQLAMRIAAESQLVSVSHLALDPLMSPMTETARGFAINRGRAEEVFLISPDLVLAEPYAARAGVEALRGLGIAVEMFEPVARLDQIPARLEQMGRALGREDAARQEIEAFNARLAALRQRSDGPRPRAALYYANGYTLGRETLAGQLLDAAGFDNVADELGMAWGGQMPLESLVMAEPDVVIVAGRYPGASRSEAVLDHPVLAELRRRATNMSTGPEWVCGTPATLDALEALVDLRESLG